MHSLAASLNRGGLKFPRPCIITVVMHAEIVLKKLLQPENVTMFFQQESQRNVFRQLIIESLPEFEDLVTCVNGHDPSLLISMIAKCAANIMLSNYCKQRNDVAATAKADAKARKLKTLTSK